MTGATGQVARGIQLTAQGRAYCGLSDPPPNRCRLPACYWARLLNPPMGVDGSPILNLEPLPLAWSDVVAVDIVPSGVFLWLVDPETLE